MALHTNNQGSRVPEKNKINGNKALSGDPPGCRLHLSRASGGIADTHLQRWSLSFPELCQQLLRPPPIGKKDGAYFVRGPFRKQCPTRADANIEYAHLIVLDGDSTLDPKTGEVTPGAPPPMSVHIALRDLDILHLLYSTHSDRQQDKGNRYRVLIPATVANKAELEACIAWLINKLHDAGCWLADVKENRAWSQSWYFPRVQNAESEYLCYAHETGQEFDVQAAVQWYRAEALFKPGRLEEVAKTSVHRDPNSVFSQFNGEHGNPEWMLEVLKNHGYKQASTSQINGAESYRLLSPHSTSGCAGIILFRGRDDNWRVYSHHNDRDPLSRSEEAVKTSDAWDLFRIFEHDGDQQAALASLRGAREPGVPVPVIAAEQHNLEDIEMAQPLDPAQFPHTKTSKSGATQLLTTIPNIRHMLRCYGIEVIYDVIGKKMETRIPGLKGCPDNADNSALTHVTSLATLNGMATGLVPSFVSTIADSNQYNPVTEYITRKPWDGVDRIEQLIATLTVREGFPEDLKRTLVRRWLISAVAAAAKSSGFRARGVLVLQGPQSIGKTTFFLSLIDDPMLRDRLIRIDHHLDAGSKDSIITGISHWIVEIGELDSSFKKDVARLKGFITGTSDKVRRPYDVRDSEYPRRTVFCASVNSENFLVDDTGNTRWWTLPVTHINYEHGIDMQQLWAQVYELYRNREQWWLTQEEERLLERYNRGHLAVNAVWDALESTLDESMDKDKWTLKSASEVLQRIGIGNPTNAQARDCGAYLRERFGDPTRSKGKTRWRVPLELNRFGP